MDGHASTKIGVLTPYSGGFYYGGVLEGIQQVALARGVCIVALQTKGLDLWWSEDSGEGCLGLDSVDGWIAVNEVECPQFLARLQHAGKPIVHVSTTSNAEDSCRVRPDNVTGTRNAVNHLVEHGHRRIAFVGALHQLDLMERHNGYLEALQAAGLSADPDLVIDVETPLESSGAAAAELLQQSGMPCTAVFAASDQLALGLVRQLRSQGYSIPEDVAVIGFDDINEAQFADPPLTTVKQSFGLLGKTAAHALIQHLVTAAPLPKLVRAPTAFIQRKSCGCDVEQVAEAPPVPRRDLSTAEWLSEMLRAIASPGSLSPLSKTDWPGADALAEYLAAAIEARKAPDGVNLADSWTPFLQRHRDAESIDRALAALESAVLEASSDSQASPRVRGTLRDLRVNLIRTWQEVELKRTRNYEAVADANARINHTLAAAGSSAISGLSWLRWTRAQYAVLALWQPREEGRGRQLRIASEYGTQGAGGDLVNQTLEAERFPPPEVFDRAVGMDGANVLSVVPVTGTGRNRGLLAVAAPIDLERLDHVGNVGDWGAQMGASLERREIEQQLRENALRDALTGLPNRALFTERLQLLLDAPSRQQSAVLLLDMDDFKRINDSLGHDEGDELLLQVSQRLAQIMTNGETLARLGGDEFAVLIPSAEDASKVLAEAERIQDRLQSPFKLGKDQVFLSCSVGVALGSRQYRAAADLLRDADTAMYRAKVQGQGKRELFHHGMHAQAIERLRLDSRLRRALDDGEFALLFQPIFGIDHGAPVGAEALIRWNHPEQGCLCPSRFLAVAEDVGLAVPISRWVLESACREAKAWQQQGRPTFYVNVNVPAQHLQEPGFADLVEEVLDRVQLPAAALGLELVESTLIEHQEETRSTLERLMERGVRVAIDDFGTGYSSLSYLKNFPISILKIDRSFVQNLPHNPRDNAIASAIITMGHGLGLTVVAEGVESKNQLAFLREEGCDLVQGYLLSRPVSAKACRQLMLQPISPNPGRLASTSSSGAWRAATLTAGV